MECTCTCSKFLCFTWKSSTRVIVYHVVEEKTCWWENAQTANRCLFTFRHCGKRRETNIQRGEVDFDSVSWIQTMAR